MIWYNKVCKIDFILLIQSDREIERNTDSTEKLMINTP